MRRMFLTVLYVVFSVKIYAGPQLILSTAEGSAVQDISIQVLQEAYAEIGYELQIIRTANVRSLLLANEGRTDGEVSRVVGMEVEFKNLQRVPVAVNILDIRAFTKIPGIDVPSWESLRGYNVLSVKGSKQVELRLTERNINCYYAAQFAQAINMLYAGRGDVAILPDVNGKQAIKEQGLSGIVMADESLEKINLYHYLNTKHAAIMPRVESALRRMQLRGRIKEIREHYLKSQYVSTEWPIADF